MSEDKVMNIPVYIPAPGAPFPLNQVVRGSGIVGREIADQPEMVEYYYEGNIYGYSNIKTFGDRVYHAYDRMNQNYPTMAMGHTKRNTLLEIGTFDGERVTLHTTMFLPRILDWLSHSAPHWLESDLVRSDLR